MNPCPCGPLLDRIDLHVEVPAVEYKTLASKEVTESSITIRERVEKARVIQRERFKSERGIHTNSSQLSARLRSWAWLRTSSFYTRDETQFLGEAAVVTMVGC